MNLVDSLSVMVRDSLLLKFFAIVFLFLALVGCLAVAVVEVLQGQGINAMVQSILFAGLGCCIHLLGLNQGVTLTSTRQGTTTPVSGMNSNVTQKLTPVQQ